MLKTISPKRLLSQGSGGISLATRGSVAKTPYFPETISCLVVIMAESDDTGHNSGLDGKGESEGFIRRITEYLSGSLGKGSQIRDQG
jgi:hypothetical protein